jgi:hypothetical protein
VLAANSFLALHRTDMTDDYFALSGRYATLEDLIKKHHGKIDRTMNFAGAEGVPMLCNLHSALLFPADLTLAVSMGKAPACKQPYRELRMTADGIVGAGLKPAPTESGGNLAFGM